MKGNIVGEDFNSRFQIVNPVMTKISYKHIERLKEKEFTIHCEVERNTLELKGQWLPSLTTGSSSSSKVLCFVVSPMIRSAKENELLGLSFSDFAIHDPSKDRLFALEALQAANRVNDIKTSTSATSFTDEASCSEDTERDILGCPSASLFRRNSIQKTIPHPLSSKSASILNPELMEKRCPGPGSDQLNHLYPPFAPRYFSPSADLSLKSYPSYKPLSLLSVFIYFLSFFFLLDSSSEYSISNYPFYLSISAVTVTNLTFICSIIQEILQKDMRDNFKATKIILERLKGDANQELFIKSICSFYWNQNGLTNFFTTMIRQDLNDNNKEKQNLPFREDTITTAVISTFLRNSCLSALRDPLRRVIMKIIDSPPQNPDSIVAYLLQFIQNLSKST